MSLRPTFMGFEASKTAIFVSQKALDIVGNNLANMSTEGYTRQRTDQVSVDNFAYKSRISNDSFNHVGMGTTLEGVSQMRDERMDTTFRNSYSETSYYSKSYDMFSELETIMSEIDDGVDGDGYGLSWGLKQMYTSLEALANNVNIPTNSTIFADSVKNMTSLLNRTSSALSEACESYKAELDSDVKDANSILDEIAVLNKQIKDVMSGSVYTEQHGPNELFDKRNKLIDELSAYGKIEVKTQSDGTADIKLNGHQCIKGTKQVDMLMTQHGNDGTIGVRWQSNNEDAAGYNGVFKATTDIINGRGLNISSENGSEIRGFKYYQDTLDAFACTLAEVLNNTIPDKLDDTGNVISYKKFVGETDYVNGEAVVYPNRKVTAANITISDELSNDPTYVLTDKSSADNKSLLNLVGKLMTGKHTIFNGVEKFEGTLQEFIIDYAAKIGDDVSTAESKYEACGRYSDEMQNNRENITGVNESEETVNMLTYNRAFQAAAKMMTTMDELLDVIINQIGALG